jgi:AcrR family transcriptional regulator
MVSSGPTVGLRARKKERTRRELLRVATRLFTERGYDQVTVQEIAAAVEVSPRTLYRYFPAKEDFVFAVFDARIQRFVDAFRQQPPTHPILESLRAAAAETQLSGDVAEELQRIQIVLTHPYLRARGAERCQVAAEGVLAAEVAARLGVDQERDVRPRLIAGCALNAIRIPVLVLFEGGSDRPLDELTEEAFTHLADGLPG